MSTTSLTATVVIEKDRSRAIAISERIYEAILAGVDMLPEDEKYRGRANRVQVHEKFGHFLVVVGLTGEESLVGKALSCSLEGEFTWAIKDVDPKYPLGKIVYP